MGTKILIIYAHNGEEVLLLLCWDHILMVFGSVRYTQLIQSSGVHTAFVKYGLKNI